MRSRLDIDHTLDRRPSTLETYDNTHYVLPRLRLLTARVHFAEAESRGITLPENIVEMLNAGTAQDQPAQLGPKDSDQ